MLLLLSWTALAVGIAGSAAVVVDNLILRYRQPVKIMELVWPVTALYIGPAAVVAYWKWGRPRSHRWRQRHGRPPRRPRQATFLIQLCHDGAHCALGTILAEAAVFAIGIDTSGGKWWVEYTSGYSMAVAIGVVFRYSAEAQRRRRRIWAAIKAFARADLAGVSAFELTLFIWLALAEHAIFPAASLRSIPVYWFITQIGLIAGFIAALPTNLWLAHHGIRAEPPDAFE
ncbi:DUF4396 domain-containing protein [Micromonospora sp. 4G55]|uniref:DUF4396 domain-containing protein n=1 Tax=Micromonospora sp. 4G55 TaxID=2806102 RepID=UPI001A617A5E|nr:DUF4396 domain-containing protein [Micromonospora sp. 4G55]MBM0256817.1 DUF4396 domain-containing protein [Micromonospora sp. 4G55]